MVTSNPSKAQARATSSSSAANKANPFNAADLDDALTAGLDPTDFMLAWGLKASEAAPLLGIKEHTLRSYDFREGSRNKKTPSESVRIAAATRTYIWLVAGLRPKSPYFLRKSSFSLFTSNEVATESSLFNSWSLGD